MSKGTFAISRSIWTSRHFKGEPFTKREAFIFLISEAAYFDHEAETAFGKTMLKRGQIVTSNSYLAKRFSWDISKVKRFLKRLKTELVIDLVTDPDLDRNLQQIC